MDEEFSTLDDELRRPRMPTSRPPPRRPLRIARRRTISVPRVKASKVVKTARWNRTLARRGKMARFLPLIQRVIRCGHCSPGGPGFAVSLAGWQSQNGLLPTGLLTPETLRRLLEMIESGRRDAPGGLPTSPTDTSPPSGDGEPDATDLGLDHSHDNDAVGHAAHGEPGMESIDRGGGDNPEAELAIGSLDWPYRAPRRPVRPARFSP
ncbi:MAG TPA: hypothetical protein VD971_08250 [Phycisphaerales bacterium]|nr:hypothetical protein [Phycisphaerales bacterium]